MTLQQLQYLVALAESNSINQAAQNLFVSQSGISKAIKQLESELGFPPAGTQQPGHHLHQPRHRISP